MKIIISHDIDHLTASEHLYDLFLAKFWIRHTIEAVIGSISAREYKAMFAEILKNKWQNIDEIMAFDRRHQVHSTFFIGVNNGLSLSYSLKNAGYWLNHIRKNGFEVGVHGISYDSYPGIQVEYARFASLSGLDKFGIRMHYLRNDKNTLSNLAQAGYLYDSTIYQLEGPQVTGQFVEFPLHLMEGRVFYQDQKFKTVSLIQAQAITVRIFEQVEKANLPYFTILFHDCYFCDAFGKWRDWYIWLIEYLKEKGFEFGNYAEAYDEVMEKNQIDRKE